MFEYFLKRNKQEQEQDNAPKISITYSIGNDDTPMIDVLLNSYNEDCIVALCSLLDILSQDSCYIETVKMISENLALHNHEDLLIKMLTHISNQKNNKIANELEHNIESQVCINPTDVVI